MATSTLRIRSAGVAGHRVDPLQAGDQGLPVVLEADRPSTSTSPCLALSVVRVFRRVVRERRNRRTPAPMAADPSRPRGRPGAGLRCWRASCPGRRPAARRPSTRRGPPRRSCHPRSESMRSWAKRAGTGSGSTNDWSVERGDSSPVSTSCHVAPSSDSSSVDRPRHGVDGRPVGRGGRASCPRPGSARRPRGRP